jgi:hypothetical protein
MRQRFLAKWQKVANIPPFGAVCCHSVQNAKVEEKPMPVRV